MATTTGISLEEYLQTSYRPDREYIDGTLKEKPVVPFVHGRVQMLLGVWFWQHQDEWHTQCAVETRTQVSTAKVRLPDIVVLSRQTAMSRERSPRRRWWRSKYSPPATAMQTCALARKI
jgi:Uma2 family endonuclease